MIRDLGAPIAPGRTAEVYAWEGPWVLKLFHDWFSLEDIEYEARMARAVHASGLSVPAVGEIVQVNGRTGLLYQRVDGDSLWNELSRHPGQAPQVARRTAELHAELHAATIRPGIPSLRQKLVGKIHRAGALSTHLRSQALAALDAMPDGESLCHGDFHPGNILATGQGEIIIDWIDAAWGNPLADLARTTIIALGAVECQVQDSQRVFVRDFHEAYLRHYFHLRPSNELEYQRWLPIIAAARLSENINELELWLIAQAEQGLLMV